MASTKQFEKWRRALDATFPLIGRMRRRRAVHRLAENRDSPEAVPILVAALANPDPAVALAAEDALSSLAAQPAVDALCDVAIGDPTGAAARIAVSSKLRPQDHERRCLFLFVTRQLDEYFKEDYDFQALRMEYDRADATVKEHVMEVVRSGDQRCVGFIGTGQTGGKVGPKPLVECNEREIGFALESFVRHKEWGRVLDACLQIPLRYSLPMLEKLQNAGWEPDVPELRSLLKQVLADTLGPDLAAPKKPDATSSLFERWLAEGQDPKYAGMSDSELAEQLKSADPPEGVRLASALATKVQPGSPAAAAVNSSPHWLVRLAGHAAGLGAAALLKDKVEDDNCWVKELCKAAGVLEFWPAKATPNDLESLNAAPAEAFAGRLGAARKVLRTILAYRTTAPAPPEPVVVTPDEYMPAEPVFADREH